MVLLEINHILKKKVFIHVKNQRVLNTGKRYGPISLGKKSSCFLQNLCNNCTHRNTQQYYTEIMMIGMLFLLTMEKNQLQQDSIFKKN